MNRLIVLFCFCATTLPLSLAAFATPIVIPPNLPVGATYRLAFATSSGFPATSSDIATYNAFVTSVANTEPALASLGTTWTAIASTATVSARDNTNTNPASMGVPIYNTDGELVASSNVDLWDGTDLINSINYDEHGGSPASGYVSPVWTGTIWNGAPNTYDLAHFPLGTPAPAWGQTNFLTQLWIYSSHGTYPAEREFSLYAISDVLTMVPEPGTLTLAATCGAAVLAIRRFQRRTRRV